MKTSRSIWLSIHCALLACFVITDVALTEPYAIHFKSGTVTPEPGTFELPAEVSGCSRLDRVHVLLQLEEYLKAGDRERLQGAGVELLAYFPDRAYAASIPRAVDPGWLSSFGIRSISPLLPDYKMSSRVVEQTFGEWSQFGGGLRIFAVEIHSDVSLDDAEGILKDAGCLTGNRFEGAHTLLVANDPAKVAEIAALDVVLFVDEAPPPMDVVNDVVRTRLHVNEVQTDPYNLSGDGVTIMVYDGGMIDSTHPDFNDRVSWNETAAVADHPTHVAGTVGGDGTNSQGNFRGMAPDARIISGQYDACIPYCLYESPNDFEADYSRARTVFGIELTTNSIGANVSSNGYDCAWMGDYETTSRLLDGFARNLNGSPLIMCFAAGNERNDAGCGLTSYRCISVPAGAKNIITVGATTSTDASASFSSWGPTDDGRIKPEVCATGVGVTSTLPGGGYGDMDGTSMATPATAGTVCLLLQKWHQMFPGAPDPLPETVKAILINSTSDIGTGGVDFQTGFGLVNALKSVQNMEANGVLESALEVGETFTRSFIVPAGTTTLDVSMAWSDVPASGNVIPTLVNDLDLRLTDPNGTTHEPWRLNGSNPGSPANRGNDSVNVCERVNVPNPVAGNWTLTVTGDVNSGASQTFGICASVTLVSTWANISGQVRNAGNSQGIPGHVAVVGGSQADLTDVSGNYLIAVPANSTYDVRGVSYGFVPGQLQVVVGGGNVTQNFMLNVAANGTLNGTVMNQFNSPIPGAVIAISFPNASIPNDTTDANGTFSAILPGSNTYEIRVTAGVNSVTTTVTIPENGTINQNFTITDPRFAPAGPDNHGYLGYEISDPGLSAEYDWLEISPQAGGAGTAIPSAGGNDWVVDITSPFPVTFYGETSTTLRVAADGWVQVGAGANGQSWTNVPIPGAGDPNAIIALFWDDLYPYHPQNGGDISYYHDQANGRFIIEYRAVPHFAPPTNTTTGQVIIYSTAVRPTMTGDNEIILQYQDLDYADGSATDADATIGIESTFGDDGIQVVYGGGWNANCFDITPGYAIRFTTGIIAGYGVIRGSVEMIPPVQDITQVNIQFGARTIHPLANGTFFEDSVAATTYDLTVTYPGYELGDSLDLVVTPDDTVSLSYRLYRLDPARNLAGVYEWTIPEIRLNWDRALSPGMGIRERDNMLDAFQGYEVWLGGTGRLATITDTFFVYAVTASRQYNFWIRSAYDGGYSDTSNHYRVSVNLSAENPGVNVPSDFYLSQNYPNPFNPATTIEFGLPHTAEVEIVVFDVMGRQVRTLTNDVFPAGTHKFVFDAGDLATGLYFYRLKTSGFEQLRKMLLMK